MYILGHRKKENDKKIFFLLSMISGMMFLILLCKSQVGQNEVLKYLCQGVYEVK